MDLVNILFVCGYFKNYTNEFQEKFKEVYGDDGLKSIKSIKKDIINKINNTTFDENSMIHTANSEIINIYKLCGNKSIVDGNNSNTFLFESIPKFFINYFVYSDGSMEFDFEEMYKELIEDMIKSGNITQEHINKKKIIDEYYTNGI